MPLTDSPPETQPRAANAAVERPGALAEIRRRLRADLRAFLRARGREYQCR